MTDEPMYLISESELDAYDRWYPTDQKPSQLLINIRARGPASAQQQAPAPSWPDPCLDCEVAPSHQCDGNPCGTKALWSREQHDAAIAAQARKEGYAEGAASVIPSEEDRKTALECWGVFFDCEKECEYKPSCRIVAQAAAAERGQVLKKMCEQCPVREEIPTDDPRCAESCEGCLARMVCGESPRSQPERQQYCKHLKWLTQVEGGGEYRCELGNKTSDEWCYKKEWCGDYELVPECGACTVPDPLDVLEQWIGDDKNTLQDEWTGGKLVNHEKLSAKIAELRQRGRS